MLITKLKYSKISHQKRGKAYCSSEYSSLLEQNLKGNYNTKRAHKANKLAKSVYHIRSL
jgi:hypothetical protein